MANLKCANDGRPNSVWTLVQGVQTFQVTLLRGFRMPPRAQKYTSEFGFKWLDTDMIIY